MDWKASCGVPIWGLDGGLKIYLLKGEAREIVRCEELRCDLPRDYPSMSRGVRFLLQEGRVSHADSAKGLKFISCFMLSFQQRVSPLLKSNSLCVDLA